jgi:hypothetical protein
MKIQHESADIYVKCVQRCKYVCESAEMCTDVCKNQHMCMKMHRNTEYSCKIHLCAQYCYFSLLYPVNAENTGFNTRIP